MLITAASRSNTSVLARKEDGVSRLGGFILDILAGSTLVPASLNLLRHLLVEAEMKPPPLIQPGARRLWLSPAAAAEPAR